MWTLQGEVTEFSQILDFIRILPSTGSRGGGEEKLWMNTLRLECIEPWVEKLLIQLWLGFYIMFPDIEEKLNTERFEKVREKRLYGQKA